MVDFDQRLITLFAATQRHGHVRLMSRSTRAWSLSLRLMAGALQHAQYADKVTTMANRKDKPTIEPTTKARAGVTGDNVRYVLAFGLVGVIIAFLIIALYYYGFPF
jgi:hypothetical protein